MGSIIFDYTNSGKNIIDSLDYYKEKAINANNLLNDYKGEGNEFLGWLEPYKMIKDDEVNRIIETASYIRDNTDVFVSIGIGGSYLGAKAIIEMLGHTFSNQLNKDKRNSPLIYFAGQNISSTYLSHLVDIIKDKEISINVISKSGTTTEPSIAFRVIKKLMVNKYKKDELKNRIIATTDKAKGTLRQLANQEGYKSFIIPDNVGGRYSVLTPVGLFPMAVSGINIKEMLKGAYDMAEKCKINDPNKNPAMMYAMVRNALYNNGKKIEILVNYEPQFHYFSEWWKQLYGESEGKNGKGIFPASCDFSTDLHSMGQYIQDGERTLFETVLNLEKVPVDIEIEKEVDDGDGLNYLAGKHISYVNDMARQGVSEAHFDGKVPNLLIKIPKLNEYYIGQLIYFFEKACGISGYMLGINPFNQPGVEDYKRNMFALLGKKGYEEESKKLNDKIQNKEKKFVE